MAKAVGAILWTHESSPQKYYSGIVSFHTGTLDFQV